MNDGSNTEHLKEHYQKIYKNDAYKNYFTFNSYWIWDAIIREIPEWRGRSVLEIGCGQGELSSMISYAGAETVYAVDYSEEAIKLAKQRVNLSNVKFVCADGHDVEGKYDAITLAGVLEHISEPWNFLDKLINDNLSDDGVLVSVMPSFMNPRGYVWMTLQMLFDVPMSLSDVHFFSPTDIKNYADKKGLDVKITTIDPDWGCGDRMLVDYVKRLPNALNDAGMKTDNVEKFIKWLEDSNSYYSRNEMNGALMVCTLSK